MSEATNWNDENPRNIKELTGFVPKVSNRINIIEGLLRQMQDKFQNVSDQIIQRIDEMGNRIDELEKNIGDLITQSGAEVDLPEK